MNPCQHRECKQDVTSCNNSKWQQVVEQHHRDTRLVITDIQTQDNYALETVLTQDCSRQLDTSSLERQSAEKPYNDGIKFRRKLVAKLISSGNCLGSSSNANLLNLHTVASQSDVANIPDAVQVNANAGCDTDFYGLTNDHNVITSTSSASRWWQAIMSTRVSFKTILFIDNQFVYTKAMQDPKCYTITVGDNSDGSNNLVCVSLATITQGGWFSCGLTGTRLSIYTTDRLTFSEIMAYSQEAIQMNALSPPVCTQCITSNPATRALFQEVTLTSTSSSLVKTGLTDSNPTIIFYLKAKTKIKAVVLLGARDSVHTYQTNTDILVKNFNDAVQSCTHINDYNTYTESDCGNLLGNTVIVQRQAPGLIIAGFGILSDCDCAQSSFDPASFTAPFTDTFVSGTSLSTIAGGNAVSITINLIIPDSVSSVCGNGDGYTKCGSRQISFRDITNSIDITSSPYKKVYKSCSASICTLILQNTVDADAATWQFEVKIWLTDYLTVFRTQVVTVSVLTTLCTIPSGSFNLMNTVILGFQSAYKVGYNTLQNIGCNGISASTATSELVYTAADSLLINYWSVQFAQTVAINTLLIIGPDTPNISNLAKTKVSFGSSTNFQQNQICLDVGQITDGGWYLCSGSGIYLALWSTTNSITFYEIMVYVSFPVQWNSVSQTWQKVQADPNYPAANVLSKIVVVDDSDTTRRKCIASVSGTASQGSLSIGFKAQNTIKLIVLIPGRNSSWQPNQKDVIVQISDVTKTVLTCGIIRDYNTYAEQVCNKSGNLVTLSRSVTNVQLNFCSVGILSDCDCSQSSLNQALIYPYPNLDTILSIQSVNVTLGTSQLQSQTILINSQISDTVSSVCGNADGISFCGDRVISLTDAATKREITSWPYGDFSYFTGTLILNPTQEQTTAIKVTVSLISNPNVKKTEIFTAIVNKAKGSQYIPTLTLQATVNITGGLVLPATATASTFYILSKQNFTAEVTDNFLTVLSLNSNDQGEKYTLSMSEVPNDPNQPTTFFNVKVKFSPVPAPSKTPVQKNKSSRPAQKSLSNQKNESITSQLISSNQTTVDPAVFSTSMSESDLKLKYNCAENDQKDMVCIDIVTGQKCIFNDKTRKLDCSFVEESAVKITIPTVAISHVNNMGFFFITFSEPMDMELFLNTTTPLPKSRRLRPSVKSTIIPVFNASLELENSYKYFFNSSFIEIQTVSGGSVNSSMLNYTWQTTNITDTVITIQARFMHPEYVSSNGRYPDKLQITLLQSMLNYYVSQKGQNLAYLPKTQLKILPIQFNLGQSSATLQQTASVLQNVGQMAEASQIVMMLVLSQALSMMWSFVNALQIFLTMPLLNVPMPGYVYLVMQNLSSLAQFDVFPTTTQDILNFMFQFTETDTIGVGFLSMGTTSKRTILYLGQTFLFLILLAVQVLAWLCCYSLRKSHPFFERAQKKLKKFLFWSAILRLAVLGCLDISIGMMISLEQLEWNTRSDIFDSLFTIISVPAMAALPLFVYLFLKKKVKILQLQSFKRKFKPLLEGFLVDTDDQKKRTTLYITWFILRRQLLSLIVVPMRNETFWIQLAFNTWLTLADVCFKIYLSPYENFTGGLMEKINQTLVLFAGYFIYLFTDYTLTLENKEVYGWFFNGILGLLIALNLSVMLTLGFQDLVKKFKRCLIIRQNKKTIDLKKMANIKKEKSKSIAKQVAERLGIDKLMEDPSEISQEAKEDIIYERGEENLEQVIARQQEESKLEGLISVKYKIRPENQNFFGHNNFVNLLDSFNFNDPSLFHEEDLKNMAEQARKNVQVSGMNNSCESSQSNVFESSESKVQIATVSEESSSKSSLPSFREGSNQMIMEIKSDPVDITEKQKTKEIDLEQPKPIDWEMEMQRIMKSPSDKPARDSEEIMSLESIEEMDPEILRQENERLQKIESRKRWLLYGPMPQTIQGKGIPDRGYDPKKEKWVFD